MSHTRRGLYEEMTRRQERTLTLITLRSTAKVLTRIFRHPDIQSRFIVECLNVGLEIGWVGAVPMYRDEPDR